MYLLNCIVVNIIYYMCYYYCCCCLQTQARTQALKDEWVKVINKILVDSVADTVDMDIPEKVRNVTRVFPRVNQVEW